MTPERTIELSLVSHTNVGKTTLVRTLLRRDIGEVADRPHVTEQAEAHVLIETGEGDALRLWDTPGFGDSARLLARLESAGTLAWLLTQVWDRFADRAFFSSQQAVRNVRDSGDVVLYLVNASEDPGAAAYVPAEMRILKWIGKPVVVLLNQTGPGRGRELDALDESAWSAHLASHVGNHRVIAFDAFARCWVQEDVLLAGVGQVLAQEKLEAFGRLREAWRERNLAVFDDAMTVLARQLATVATDREALSETGRGIANVAQEARRLLASIAGKPSKEDAASDRAMGELASRLDRTVRESTDRLIALHGLSGRATERILARLAAQFEVSRAADVNASGVLGGVVTGALGGLAADLSAGGLTLGAGMLLGGVLGALGAGGAAQAYNLMRGADAGRVRWSTAFLEQRPAAALLRYLAVAHYGRGRGDWVESEYPPHWRTLVDSVVDKRRGRFEEAWALAAEGRPAPELEARLQPLVAECARAALSALYPEAASLFSITPAHS